MKHQLQLAFYARSENDKKILPPLPSEFEIREYLKGDKCPLSNVIVGPDNFGNMDILRTFAFTALKRFNRSCRGCNFGLFAASGQGKTYIAKQWAETIGIPFILVESATLDTTYDLFNAICKKFEDATHKGRSFPPIERTDSGEYYIPPCVVAFDEAHALNKRLMKAGLLNAMESKDGQMTVKEPGSNGEIFKVNCKLVCWVAMTTERGQLFDAFSNRLGTAIEWQPATDKEIPHIVKIHADIEHKKGNIHCKVPMEACELVAKYRRVPRDACNFIVLMSQKKDMHDIWTWEEVAKEVAKNIGLNEYGMTRKQVMIVEALGKRPIAQSRIHQVAQCRKEQVEKFELPGIMDYSTPIGPLVVPVAGKGLCLTKAGLKRVEELGIPNQGRKVTAEYFEEKQR